MLATSVKRIKLKIPRQKLFSTSACLRTGDLHDVEKDLSTTIAPPRQARVVICGGGTIGSSVAYHLGKLSWGPDTVLIEQNRFVNN